MRGCYRININISCGGETWTMDVFGGGDAELIGERVWTVIP